MDPILIVDDNDQNLYFLQVILKNAGYEVEMAMNGEEALQMAMKSTPSLIISDILMPKMDGFALCKEWHRRQQLKHIPFVFYTATYTDEQDEVFALSLGADLFLVKPQPPDVVLDEVKKILSNNRKVKQLSEDMQVDEATLMVDYNQALIRKLEKKMLDLEEEIKTRKEAQDNLRISEERLKLATVSASAGVWEWNFATHQLHLDTYLKACIGFKEDEEFNLKDHWHQVVPLEERLMIKDSLNAILSGKKSDIELTHRLKPRSGETRWFMSRGTVLKNDLGENHRFVCITMDMTDQIEAQKETAMLAYALKSVHEYVCITDKKGTIVYTNETLTSELGYENTQLKGEPIQTLFSPEEVAASVQPLLDRVTRTHQSIETHVNHHSGLATPVLLSCSSSGASRYLTWVFSNISQLIEKEKQLRFSQKMETIGTLSTGVAHDVNNILLAILGNTELSLIQLGEGSPVDSNLKQILKATDRCKTLVSQLLYISKERETSKKQVNISDILKEVLSLMQATMPSLVRVKHENNLHHEVLFADQVQMHQVFMNLCTNAAHAMQLNGGILYIKTENIEVTKQEGDLAPGMYVCVTVKDDGAGMEPEILDHIFEPFFTTKQTGCGTGLGLFIVHGIVKNHKGSIRVTSETGIGTQFTLMFPTQMEEKTVKPDDSEGLPTGRGHILVVDDEEMLTKVIESLLLSIGYTPTTVTNPEEAIQLIQPGKHHFDLLITDYTMPEMTGIQLIKSVRDLDSDLPIILSTGSAGNVNQSFLMEYGVHSVLFKPFNHKKLAHAVHEALSNSRRVG